MRTPFVALVLSACLATAGAQAAGVKAKFDAEKEVAPGVTSRAFHLASPSGRDVTGVLISGASSASRPGVLFVHWFGDPATTNHTQFEPDAIALAARGTASVLVDADWSKKGWFEARGKSAGDDVKNGRQQVQDLRAGLDLLMAQPNVDPSRIALVAHDFGAMFGALVAKADPRPRYFVFLAPTRAFADWYLLANKPENLEAYHAGMKPLDILDGLKASKGEGYLFQFGASDKYVTAAAAADLVAASPLPHGMFLYTSDHDLAVPAARRDRLAWLEDKLFGN